MATADEALVEQAPVALATLDKFGIVVFANSEAERLLGADIVGRPLVDVFSLDGKELAAAYISRLVTAAPGTAVFFDGQGVRRDGSKSWLEVRGRALDGPDLNGVAVAVISDVVGVRDQIEELRRQSLTDTLTGLANRTVLLERLESEHRAGSIGVVLFLDLDGFKLVNDRFGHSFGDRLLTEVGQRIETCMPTWATVARFGGDEFAVLLPRTSLPDGEAYGAILLEAVGVPVVSADGTACSITGSLGVASMEPGSSNSVLRNADVAMYEAKRDGKGAVRTYRPDSAAYVESRRNLLAKVDQLQQRNEQLTAQALTDTLTKLPNRRAFDEALAAIDEAARARHESYGVADLDIDHFHDLNRAFDDEVGDAALRTIAEALAGACRSGDVVYRKGGEELVALLVGADLEAAQATAERFAEVVRSLAIPPGCSDCEVVTISGGVSALDPARHRSAAAVVAEANHAMLLAKRGGRDQVRSSPSGSAVQDS